MVDKYKFIGDRSFRISDYPTHPAPKYDKKEARKLVKENVEVIEDFRERLATENKRSVLIIFQAIDAAGKDGTIKRLVTGLNSATIDVTSFKKPTDLEAAHDFLWRVHKSVPRKGRIGIFNRSHYEEVLVTRVHPSFIMGQKLPGIESVEDIDKTFWESRFEQIRNFEDQLVKSGTIVLKFFLNISKEVQKGRIIDRMEDPLKRYKFNLTDVKQRAFWNEYRECFEDMINNTSQPHSPWYVIPADDKNTMRVLVTTKVREELEKIHLDPPSYDGDFESDSVVGRKLLEEL